MAGVGGNNESFVQVLRGGFPRFRKSKDRVSGFDPRINRWTGQPHEHKREIARRLRQQKSA